MRVVRQVAVRPRPAGAALRAGAVWLLACVALLISACAPMTHAQGGPYFPVIRTPNTSTTPTPGPLQYTVGAWPSNSTPPSGGFVTIYVSFRNAGAPVSGAWVTVDAYYPGHYGAAGRGIGAGPLPTGAQGYVGLALPVGPPLSRVGSTTQTVQVTATVNYQGNTYTATSNFTPLP